MSFDLSTLGPLAGSLIKAGAPTLGSVVGTLVGGPFGTIAGGLAGNVLADIAGALGAPADAPPAAIQAAIEADPSAASAKLQQLEDGYKTEIEDRADARRQTIELAKAGSEIAWAAPAVSVIIIAGFIALSLFVIVRHGIEGAMAQLIAGALISKFGTVTDYWMGSSSSSRRNMDTIRTIATAPLKSPLTGKRR